MQVITHIKNLAAERAWACWFSDTQNSKYPALPPRLSSDTALVPVEIALAQNDTFATHEGDTNTT